MELEKKLTFKRISVHSIIIVIFKSKKNKINNEILDSLEQSAIVEKRSKSI